MTAEQFLDALGKKGFVSAEVIGQLRRQVTTAEKPVPVERIVKLLQSKGYVTAVQARQLLAESESAGRARDPGKASSAENDAPPKKGDLGAPEDDDGDLFELVPIDDAPAAEEEPAIPRVAPLAPPNEAPLVDDAPLLQDSTPPHPRGRTEDKAMADLLADTMADVPPTASWDHGGTTRRGGPLRWLPLGRRRARGAESRQTGNPWDSPLLLIGGGALILLVLVGGALLYLIYRGSGDTLLKMAEDAYRDESYTQAIDKYNRFLERYPGHASVSLATVHRGLAQLRQTLQATRNRAQQLATAKRVLKEIESENEFAEARAELAAILPEIADGLAQQARKGTTAAEVQENVGLTNEALALVMNTNYVPSSLRPSRRVQQVRETLELVQRDLSRDESLDQAITAIRSATTAGDIRQAYAIRAGLLKSYPSLASDAALGNVVQELTRAEKANVKLVRETIAALSDDPLPRSVGLAARQGPDSGGQASTPVLVGADGAIAALDAVTGRLLWRRPVGIALRGTPAAVVGPDGKTALLVDTTRHELVCVELASGRFKWRFPIGERFATPSVLPKRILVAATSGKLYVLDPISGRSTEHLLIPQGLRTAPVFAPRAGVIYQLGQHSSLYVLSAADLSCRQVLCLGHAKGSVAVAPVVALNHVVVVENRGATAATLHVLVQRAGPAEEASDRNAGDRAEASRREDASNPQEPVLTVVQQLRLAGHVLTPPVVDGRLLVVATDRGQSKLFEVASGDSLAQVAERSPVGKESQIRFPLLHDGSLWIAGTKLTKLQIQPQTGQLTPQGLALTYRGDVFDAPLQHRGDSLITLRRRAGHDGASVAATAMKSGQQVWETRIGMRPAAPPQVDAASDTVTLLTTSGRLFQLDQTTQQRGVADLPRSPSTSPDPIPQLTERIELEGQRCAYASAHGGYDVLVCNLHKDRTAQPLKWLRLADDLACAPGAFGSGLLAPTRQGQVRWIDAETGAAIAEAFQPTLKQASMPSWLPPRAADLRAREFLIADRIGLIYRVGIKDAPTRHLVTLAKTAELSEPIIAPPVVLGETVFAATSAGQLLPFQLPDMQGAAAIELGGRARWGPHRVGRWLLLTTEADELLCIDQGHKVVWRGKLPYGPLAGVPYAANQRIVLAAISGTVWQIDATTGKEQGKAEAGEPLGSGPVPFGPKWVLAAANGAVVVLTLPDHE